jgi:hypothetical protein
MNPSVSKSVSRRVLGADADRIWTYSDFKGMPETAVAAALSRLAKKDVIRRIRKGMYYRPRTTRFGETRPETPKVAEAALRNKGIRVVVSGLPAYNRLGLTNQVSPHVTFDVERNISKKCLPDGIRVRMVSNLGSVDSKERVILDALRDIRSIPDATVEGTFSRITELFRNHTASFDRVAVAALKEPPRVRALVGAIGTALGVDNAKLDKLEDSLNKTTHFSLGLSDKIPEVKAWGIR